MDPIRIILICMIKNEEKIIKRCIDSVKDICDAFSITDTGSTDNSIPILKDYFIENELDSNIYEDVWKDFGYNRTLSYYNAIELCKTLNWDTNRTYGLLLDADMKLVINNFDKQKLSHNGYKIIQDGGSIEYYNTRLIKLNGSWNCIGVTHEYWSGEDVSSIKKDNIFINDIVEG